MNNTSEKTLKVSNLKIYFKAKTPLFSPEKFIKAVDSISFDVYDGESLGIVGESGCGKSSLARALVGLNEITDGSVIFAQKDELHKYSKKQWRKIYQEIQLVFQDPVAALDPRMTIANIIMEPLHAYRRDLNRQQKLELVIDMMEKVGLKREYLNRYPTEFSGGQCQRVVIARALIVKPKLLICDEAVSALDTTMKIQIVQLLKKLQRELNLTIIFISHDLGIVKNMCDRVMVMYLGNIMEVASTVELYTNPQHPYTQALLNAALVPDPKSECHKPIDLLTGELPSNIDVPLGCVFASRCTHADESCTVTRKGIVQTLTRDRQVACFKTSLVASYKVQKD